MSSGTLLDVKINYDTCPSLKSTIPNQHTLIDNTAKLHVQSSGDLKCFPQIIIKQEPIHLTEEDFRESLRNTWLPDIDTNGVSIVANDVKKEYSTFLDTSFHNMDNVPCTNENNVGTTEPVSNMLTCPTCRKQFFDPVIYQEHQKTCVKPVKKFLCATCNKVFSTKSRLQNHTRIHTGIKPYACSVCSKAFADRSAFIKHEKIHFRLKEEKVECTLCGGLFSDAWGLKKHQLTHSGERPYECPICHKCFRTSSTLVVHKRIHTGEKPYPCTLCEKRFTVKTHLVTHNRTHSGERPYECTVCGRAFSDRSSWRRHSRRHDTTTDPLTANKQTKTTITNNGRLLSAIESLQNFVTEQYMKPPTSSSSSSSTIQLKTENNQIPETFNKTPADDDSSLSPTGGTITSTVQFSTPKPFFENFHRFFLEQQVIKHEIKPVEQSEKEKSLVSPFFKNFQQTLMEQKFNESKDSRDEESKVSEENNSPMKEVKKTFYRNSDSPIIVIPSESKSNPSEQHSFPNIIHYNAGRVKNVDTTTVLEHHPHPPPPLPPPPPPPHHTFKAPGQSPYNYPYFVSTTTDDTDQSKYDTNFNQYPSISQFQSLTNVISIPMAAAAATHGSIAQKNLKLFSKVSDHSTTPHEVVDPNTTTSSTIQTSFPPPIYNNYAMNFMDNSAITNPDKNVFLRRS